MCRAKASMPDLKSVALFETGFIREVFGSDLK
jgi:hypothetical protein